MFRRIVFSMLLFVPLAQAADVEAPEFFAACRQAVETGHEASALVEGPIGVEARGQRDDVPDRQLLIDPGVEFPWGVAQFAHQLAFERDLIVAGRLG